MIKRMFPSVLIMAALLASALPSAGAKADAISSWLANLPAGGNIRDDGMDPGFCLSGWQLGRTQDGKIFWWHCGDGGL